ncbi:ADP-ribose 1''-phosphate phosphatase [Fusarium sp. Ph1]|nr:ADP-ribose 1''-phosphate phosphatase [Fusarium sp. Ph1]
MFATKILKMATKSIGDIPILTQLYADSTSLLSIAAIESSQEPAFPANDDINRRIGYMRGDITRLRLDAIVNAANRLLQGGGGVDGAINAAAGPELVRESAPLGPIETGEAVITKGYNLPAQHVIHTVGPIYREVRNPEESLASCYRESLKLAVKHGLRTVAFSAISTGIYGFPSQRAAYVACKTVREFLETDDGSNLLRVVFVTFMPKDVNAYNNALPRYFPPTASEGQ